MCGVLAQAFRRPRRPSSYSKVPPPPEQKVFFPACKRRASLMILKFAITDELPMDRLIGIFLPLIALR